MALWTSGYGAALLAALVLGAAPVFAEAHRPAGLAIWSAEGCLSAGDAAFEQSLSEGLAQEDQDALALVYSTATFECLGLSMEICERLGDGEVCLSDLSTWVRDDRAALVAPLPEVLETEDASRAANYASALERAGVQADEANCDEMSDEQRARYCVTVAEGVALEDAYAAWRMARQEGVVELVGHDPVDLESIR